MSTKRDPLSKEISGTIAFDDPRVAHYTRSTGPRVPTAHRAVFRELGRYIDPETGWGSPSLETIADHTDTTRQTASTCMRDLEDLGLLVIRQKPGTAGRQNEYFLTGFDTDWKSSQKNKLEPNPLVKAYRQRLAEQRQLREDDQRTIQNLKDQLARSTGDDGYSLDIENENPTLSTTAQGDNEATAIVDIDSPNVCHLVNIKPEEAANHGDSGFVGETVSASGLGCSEHISGHGSDTVEGNGRKGGDDSAIAMAGAAPGTGILDNSPEAQARDIDSPITGLTGGNPDGAQLALAYEADAVGMGDPEPVGEDVFLLLIQDEAEFFAGHEDVDDTADTGA